MCVGGGEAGVFQRVAEQEQEEEEEEVVEEEVEEEEPVRREGGGSLDDLGAGVPGQGTGVDIM
jgi:hypothetical protein